MSSNILGNHTYLPQLKLIHIQLHTAGNKVRGFCGIGTATAATVQESNLALAVEVVCNQIHSVVTLKMRNWSQSGGGSPHFTPR